MLYGFCFTARFLDGVISIILCFPFLHGNKCRLLILLNSSQRETMALLLK